MKDRLLLFLQETGMNSAQFALKIGVQRSSISHIISGRNKPSYDFLLKMIECFPMLNIEWILTGNGKMFKSNYQEMTRSLKKDGDHSDNKSDQDELKKSDIQSITGSGKYEIEPENEQEYKNAQNEGYGSKQHAVNRKIEKIIIFYQDMTFSDYTPR